MVRKSEQPFGGIQLIVCGDFFQLPPVERDSEAKKECMKFAFQVSHSGACQRVHRLSIRDVYVVCLWYAYMKVCMKVACM